ncbi:la protein 1-like [Populus alba x Populus x berolinensis]|nr:la protein 1-like [Populus alba x Populus x berolinensis]
MATPSLDEETTKEVLRQVEYYFSDSNIPRDNFLRNIIESSEDGMASLALICSFKKMKGHLKLMDVKPEEIPEVTVQAVAETLRKSTSLKVSEDGKKVGRIAGILKPDEAIEQLDVRTIAASPLKYNVKREELELFFGQHAKVTSVRMPRHVGDKRVFCGTALIEFSLEEEAEKILKQSLVFEGAELELKPKREFDTERVQEEEEFENSHRSSGSNNKNSSNGEANYPKGLIIAFALKNKLAGGSAEQNGAQEPANDDANACDGGSNSSENLTNENEQKVPENIKTDEENNGEEVDGDNGSESTVIKTEEEKSYEDPNEKEEVKEKPNPAASKDDKNVVLREDLKAVFEIFGIVKVLRFSFSLCSCFLFL